MTSKARIFSLKLNTTFVENSTLRKFFFLNIRLLQRKSSEKFAQLKKKNFTKAALTKMVTTHLYVVFHVTEFSFSENKISGWIHPKFERPNVSFSKKNNIFFYSQELLKLCQKEYWLLKYTEMKFFFVLKTKVKNIKRKIFFRRVCKFFSADAAVFLVS